MDEIVRSDVAIVNSELTVTTSRESALRDVRIPGMDHSVLVNNYID